MLRKEAEIWKRLRHYNVLRFLGVVEIRNEVYLASTWMPLGDLSTFVASRVEYFQLAVDDVGRTEHPHRAEYSQFSEHNTVRMRRACASCCFADNS